MSAGYQFDPAAPGRGPRLFGERYVVTTIDTTFQGTYVGVVLAVEKPGDTLLFRIGPGPSLMSASGHALYTPAEQTVRVPYGELVHALRLARCSTCGLRSLMRHRPGHWVCQVCGAQFGDQPEPPFHQRGR